MRYAAATNPSRTSDLDLVYSCKHDRLRAALSGGTATALAAPRVARYEMVTSAETFSSTSRAYVVVAAMSLVSLFGLVVGNAVVF